MTTPPDWRDLLELLADENRNTRNIARDALRRHAAADIPGVIDALVDLAEALLSSDSDEVQQLNSVVETLIPFKEQEPAGRALMRVLADEQANHRARELIVSAFRTTAPDSQLLRGVTLASRSLDDSLRLEAATFLAEATAAPAARDPLEALRHDGNPNIRNEAIRGLYQDPARWTLASDENSGAAVSETPTGTTAPSFTMRIVRDPSDFDAATVLVDELESLIRIGADAGRIDNDLADEDLFPLLAQLRQLLVIEAASEDERGRLVRTAHRALGGIQAIGQAGGRLVQSAGPTAVVAFAEGDEIMENISALAGFIA